jgi:hypothetical protein
LKTPWKSISYPVFLERYSLGDRDRPGSSRHSSDAAHNDGDTVCHRVVNVSETFDDEPGGPHSVTAQATQLVRQVNHVVFISSPDRKARFLGLPTWYLVLQRGRMRVQSVPAAQVACVAASGR